jgi:hypothetical protein
LEQIKALYAVEEEIPNLKLAGDAKQLHRLTHSKPLVEVFFEWVDRQLQRQGFTPSNPFIQALNYVRERRVGLEVFLVTVSTLALHPISLPRAVNDSLQAGISGGRMT